MKAVVQRVSEASVRVDGQVTGQIHRGFLVLLGVEEGDNDTDREWIVGKISRLRVFADSEKPMNADLKSVSGSILLVSQFTLLADVAKENRPSFSKAAPPDLARLHYDRACEDFRQLGHEVQTGIFGASMQVSLINDGPVTIMLDSRKG